MLIASAAVMLGSLIVNALAAPAILDTPTLRFKKDGTFQLSVFEDLHYGEAENLWWGPAQDTNSTRVMNTILDVESPDLVVLNGDLITGENTYLHNSTHYLDRIVAPLVSRNLLWASTYGNHDSNFNLSRKDLYHREKRYTNSLTKPMVPPSYAAGLTNYYLPVYSYNMSETTPTLLLWFFDSRGGNEFQTLDSNGDGVGIPEYVDDSVVVWFNSTKTKLHKKYGKVIPSLGFVHIPTNAMLAFQNQGVPPHKDPGINDDVPLAPQELGMDDPFMAALLNTTGLMGVFSGHDHGDDWCFNWNKKLPGMNLTGNGLNLCFSRHSGYGGYGCWTRGARQILVNEKTMTEEGVQTWNRLEDESIVGSIWLNSTFGHDKYPSVPTTYTC